MKKILTFLILLISISALSQEKSEQKVRESFENYRQAILNDKGEEAIKYISDNTFDYYHNILNEVKLADSTRIEDLSLIDKLTVLIIRHRTPSDKIKSFDKKTLVVYALDEGMIGKETVKNYSIGSIYFEDENTALGQLIVNAKSVSANFRFFKEDNNWKIDITSVMPGTNDAFEKMIESSGMNENEFIFLILENLTSVKPEPSIWKPII